MEKLLCLALMLFGVISIFAQEKIIDKTEFDSIYKAAFSKLSGKAYRSITTNETNTFFNSATSATPRQVLTKTVLEILPGVGVHMIYEADSSLGKTKTETVKIANKTYKREGSGEWKEIMPTTPQTMKITTETVDSQIEYKFIGINQFDGQKASIYSISEKNKMISSKSNNESVVTNITKHWIAENGRLLKTERKRENSGINLTVSSNTTILYELDPTIKIEVPELAKNQ